MQKELEIWKDIPNCEGIYLVSSYGKVKSLDRMVNHYNGRKQIKKGKLFKTRFDKDGYPIVLIKLNGKPKLIRVHQLVAMAFLNHTPCGNNLVVNHKDFNKQNNHISNLEIITNRENTNKKHIKSKSNYVGVSKCSRSEKWRSRIFLNGKSVYLGCFNTEIEAHEAYKQKLNQII